MFKTPISDFLHTQYEDCGFKNQWYQTQYQTLRLELILKIEKDKNYNREKARVLSETILEKMYLKVFKQEKDEAEAWIKSKFDNYEYQQFLARFREVQNIPQYHYHTIFDFLILLLFGLLDNGLKDKKKIRTGGAERLMRKVEAKNSEAKYPFNNDIKKRLGKIGQITKTLKSGL